MGVQFWSLGKQEKGDGVETQVSHGSHRRSEKGCVKWAAYVKSEFKSAWINGMEKPHPPQEAKVLQTLGGHVKRVERLRNSG